MNQQQVCEKFFWHVRANFKSQKQAANHFNISAPYMSQICSGKKAPTEEMLAAIGLQAVISYEPLELPK